MPRYITIPFPKPRQAKNLFEPADTFQSAVGIDLLSNTAELRPFPQKMVAVANPTSGGATNMHIRNSIRASDGKYYVVGSATISAATNLVLFTTTQIVASPTWTLRYNVSGTPSDAITEYKDGVFVGYGTNLIRWGNISGSPSNSTITASLTTALDILLNHKGLGILFFVHNDGKTVGRYDNSTVSLSTLNIGTGERIVSMKEFGSYVLLGLRSQDTGGNTGAAKSRVVVWDGSDTAIVDQSIIDDMGLGTIQVVGSTVVAICTTFGTIAGPARLRIYQGSPGGQFQLTEWKEWYNGKGSSGFNDNAADVDSGRVWFAPQFVSGTTDGGIFIYDPLRGSMYCAMIPIAGTTDDTFSSLRKYGTDFLTTYSDSSNTRIINSYGHVPAQSMFGTYETNVFPLDFPEIGRKTGKIKTIYMNHKPIPNSCGFTVSIKQYGAYPYGTTVPASPSYQELIVSGGSGGSVGKTQGTENATFTEISSPLFLDCKFAQLKIAFDDTAASGAAPEIATPIVIELAD